MVKTSWNKGLTKETDERVRCNALAVSKAKKGKPNGRLGCKHSIETRKKISNQKKLLINEKHPHWSGGTFYYWHKQAKKIVERITGIKLGNMRKKKIVIHHIDNNHKNNSINNLIVMTCSAHSELHRRLERGCLK